MPITPMGPMAPPMGGSPAGGPPMPPVEGGGPGEGGGSPDQIKGQLVMLLRKAKEMAEANGVNWNEVMSAVGDSKVKSDQPLPRPPAAPGY